MHYVALSRVTTLSGLYLKDLNEEKICISRNVANYIADARKMAKLVLSYVPLYTYRTDQLKIIYNNYRSYKKHYHDIQANYNMMAADIICIAETQLGPADKVVNSNMKGYKLYCLDQAVTGHTYHGLILYVNDNICVSSAITYPGHDVEAIKLVLQNGIDKLVVIAIYNSPQTRTVELYTTIQNMLTWCKNVPVIIMGDFNINTLRNNKTSLCNYMKTNYNSNQYVKESTTKTDTTIDLVFSNVQNLTIGTIDCYWPDHKMVYAVM